MFIADSQVHIWAAETPERPWRAGPRNAPHRPEPFTKDDLLAEMDAAGVTRAVLVPPSLEGDRNDLVLDAAAQHPDRFVAMGRIGLDDPGNIALVQALKNQPGMRGFRVTFASAGKVISTARDASWLWSAAEREGVPLMISQSPDLFGDIRYIAESHPGLAIAVDHFAVVRHKLDDDAFANMPKLVALAALPNISVKMSALPCYSSEDYPYRGIHRHLEQAYDAFGPERLFWGTDFTRLPCTYRQAVTLFTEELPFLSDHDKEWIMGKALCAWLGWELPAGV